MSIFNLINSLSAVYLKKYIPKNSNLFLGINCTQGGNRTHTSEETGF